MFGQDSGSFSKVCGGFDIVLTIVSFVVAFFIHGTIPYFENVDIFNNGAFLPLIIALLILILPYCGAYQSPRFTSLFSYAWSVLLAMTITIAIVFTCIFFLKITYISRGIIFLFFIVNLLSLFLIRVALVLRYRVFMSKKENLLKILIIGTGDRATAISKELLSQDEVSAEIIGYLDRDSELVGEEINGIPVVGLLDEISEIFKNYVIDEVVFAVPRSLIEDVQKIAYACEEEGIKLRLMADLFDLHVARTGFVMLGKIPLLTREPVAQDSSKLLVKRFFDIICCILVAPLLLPVFICIAVAVKLESPGPAFFLQDRIGLKKRVFKMYKFRSMVVNSEAMLADLEGINEADGPIFKIKDDPRVTKVGKFIRRTSLDELPQLINVFFGDMSLVG
ncbi:sugar transferase, partial [bacterium]|nr:sugar transferase [bacterium]